jgi:hypothetical protein
VRVRYPLRRGMRGLLNCPAPPSSNPLCRFFNRYGQGDCFKNSITKQIALINFRISFPNNNECINPI